MSNIFRRCPSCHKILDFTHTEFYAIVCVYCRETILKDQLIHEDHIISKENMRGESCESRNKD